VTSRKEHGEYLLHAVLAMGVDVQTREILARSFGLDPEPLMVYRLKEACEPQDDSTIAQAMRIPMAKVARLRARALRALSENALVHQANREIRGTRDPELRRIEDLDRSRERARSAA